MFRNFVLKNGAQYCLTEAIKENQAWSRATLLQPWTRWFNYKRRKNYICFKHCV